MNKYAIAGKELVKGNIGNAITALTIKSTSSALIQPSTYRNGNFFFGVNGADKLFIWGNYNSSLKAYQQCPVVSAIINKKAQAVTNGVITIKNGEGKESQTVQAKAIRKLMANPNPYQSGKVFRAQASVYKQIYGYCPVLVIKSVGFEYDISTWKLFNLPPWMLTIQDSDDIFYMPGSKKFKSIELNYIGKTIHLNSENVFFLTENQISTSTYSGNGRNNVSLYLPDSKLESLTDNIDNLVSSLNSRGSLVRQRGPLWILSNDNQSSADAGDFPVDPIYKQTLELDFSRLGVLKEQQKAIITDAKLKLQTVGFDVAQLQLLEGEIQDAKMIADGLSYPPYLLGLVDAKFDNQQIAERNLYDNAIIPDCESEMEQWTQLFGLDETNIKLCCDFSHLSVFQQDKEKTARAQLSTVTWCNIAWRSDIITWNEYRKELGKEPVADMDKYLSDLMKDGRVNPLTLQPTDSSLLNNQLQALPAAQTITNGTN